RLGAPDCSFGIIRKPLGGDCIQSGRKDIGDRGQFRISEDMGCGFRVPTARVRRTQREDNLSRVQSKWTLAGFGKLGQNGRLVGRDDWQASPDTDRTYQLGTVYCV